MISVIIPAHNEEEVIQRCLDNLIYGINNGLLEVIVVCNGCSDKTASIVKKLYPRVNVIESNIPSKSNALNLGDNKAKYFPRVYLDADVVVTYSDLDKVVSVLCGGEYLAACPEIEYDLTKSSSLVKSYYKIWTQNEYFNDNPIGSGFYGLTKEGRERFVEFPDIIADDEYVRLQFNNKERKTIHNTKLIVYPPRKVSDLINIKTRVYLGNRQIEEKYPDLLVNKQNKSRTIVSLLTKPQLFGSALIYLVIRLIIGIKVKSRSRIKDIVWERDKSSRS